MEKSYPMTLIKFELAHVDQIRKRMEIEITF